MKAFKHFYVIALFLLLPVSLFSFNIQQDIIARGGELIGTPYRYGGTNPSGFDCSGLVNYLYKSLVDQLPRTAIALSKFGILVSPGDLKAGDLVFYATGSSDQITHVGIYIGQDTLIQSVSGGPERGVILTDINEPYWKNRYSLSRRILEDYTQVDQREPEAVIVSFKKGNYSGTVLEAEPEGYGEMVLTNGDIYRGQFSGGQFHGTGEYQYSNGEIYRGQFISGRESDGKLIRSDGTSYLAYRDENGRLFIGGRLDRSSTHINYLLTPSMSWDQWQSLETGKLEALREAESHVIDEEKKRFEEWKKKN